MNAEKKAQLRALLGTKPKPRCGKCGCTVGRHFWTEYGGQCPEKYQPGLISGIPSNYFEPAVTA